jgi:flagellar biosynthesis protein FlhF
MIIKKYVADTMSEALSMIKFDLGPEAVIISKRAVKQKGLLGLLSPKKLEVTAAVDENRKVETDHSEKVEEIKEAAQKKEIEEELNQVKEMLQKLVDEKKVKKEKKPSIKKMLLDRDVSEDVINSIISNIKEKEEYKNNAKIPDSALGIRRRYSPG